MARSGLACGSARVAAAGLLSSPGVSGLNGAPLVRKSVRRNAAIGIAPMAKAKIFNGCMTHLPGSSGRLPAKPGDIGERVRQLSGELRQLSLKRLILGGFSPTADEFRLGQATNFDIDGKMVARMGFGRHRSLPL
ncbi:MAG: hypothetical protein O6909_12745, partial [Alphaproteobacteria bacterium]|nr:hypothetical protein [Alphaproteobacteria bacterium]